MSRSTPTSHSRSPLPVAVGSSDPLDSGLRSRDVVLSSGEREVIAIFVQMAQALGAPRSLGEIYGLLFATPQPLPFQEIADRLKLSKGSVSQGLRFLRTVGAIKPVVVAQDRREFFEPVVELRALVGGFFKERLNPQLEAWGTRVKTLKVEHFVEPEAIQSETSGLTSQPSDLSDQRSNEEVLGSRLDKLKTWHKRANTVLPMIGKLLG